MALQIDGFSVLNSISNHTGVFESVKAVAEKAAIDLVVRQMKGPAFSLGNLREIEAALGAEAFLLITDQLPVKELPKILKKVDPHFAELKTANQSGLLTRIRSLSSGEAEPTIKPTAASKRASNSTEKGKAAPKETKPRALSSKAMGAKRK